MSSTLFPIRVQRRYLERRFAALTTQSTATTGTRDDRERAARLAWWLARADVRDRCLWCLRQWNHDGDDGQTAMHTAVFMTYAGAALNAAQWATIALDRSRQHHLASATWHARHVLWAAWAGDDAQVLHHHSALLVLPLPTRRTFAIADLIGRIATARTMGYTATMTTLIGILGGLVATRLHDGRLHLDACAPFTILDCYVQLYHSLRQQRPELPDVRQLLVHDHPSAVRLSA